MDVRLIVHKRKSIYDNLIITPEYVINYENIKKYEGEDENESKLIKNNTEISKHKITPIFMNKRGFEGHVASSYVFLLKNSDIYRRFAIRPLKYLISIKTKDVYPKVLMSNTSVIFMKLFMPKKQFLDYKWNRIITTLALERREISYAMSWLSTLGGAFSAMGEQFDVCAKVAGKISLHQFKLALRLNDPLLIARCRLYACLSLIQQKKFQLPKTEIPSIFEYAKINKDNQLEKMCQGVWAKFKYCYYLEKKKK